MLTSYECVQACRDWEEERTVSADSSLSGAAGRRGPGSAAVTQQKREGRFSGNHGRGEYAAGRGVGGGASIHTGAAIASTGRVLSGRPTCRSRSRSGACHIDSPLPHLHRDSAHSCHICARTRLIPATSAPGLGSFLPHLRPDSAHSCPHLHRDSARRRTLRAFERRSAHRTSFIRHGCGAADRPECKRRNARRRCYK